MGEQLSQVAAWAQAAIEAVARLPHGHGTLICGEPGSGRETLARLAHAHCCLAPETLVVVDCGAGGADDVEQTLFGNVLTCAKAGSVRAGVQHLHGGSALDLAREGSLVLRRVEQLPERVQLRLLRILRDREALVFGKKVERLNVRPIAIVEPPSEDLVSSERVRSDLYKRLSAVVVRVPPLRERREEIPMLATSFLEDVCLSTGIEPKRWSPAAASLLSALPWHGNVRELRNLIEVVTMQVANSEIDLDAVLTHLRLDTREPGLAPLEEQPTLRHARLRFEREYIATVLAMHHGRIPEAASALGIQRTNLYRKLRSLRLARAESSSKGVAARCR